MTSIEIKEMILENFINWYASDDVFRKSMKKSMIDYIQGDHVDEITQAGWIKPMNKPEQIKYIKEVLEKWGIVSVYDLELDNSPVFASINDTYQLVEQFNNDDVVICTYVNGQDIGDNSLTYEELNDELINEIYEIIKDYEKLSLEK
jgi:hypothetical protein